MAKVRFGILAPIVLCAAATLAYWPSFAGAFVFDDHFHIVNKTSLRSGNYQIPWTEISQRPLVEASLILNHRVSGIEPWSYHLFNLLVHMAAGLLLFVLLRRVFEHCGKMLALTVEGAERLAFLVALIWLLHPIQTSAVTYVIQRAEVMMACGYLLALHCLCLLATTKDRAWVWILTAGCAAWLGMAAKMVILTLPLLALLLDRTLFATSFLEALKKRRAYYLALSSAWIPLVMSRFAKGLFWQEGLSTATVGFQVRSMSAGEYLLTQPGVLLRYFGLMFWPQNLSVDWGWPKEESLMIGLGLGALIVLLLAALVWGFVKGRQLAFLGLAFFVILAPTSSFVPLADPLVEHRLYLPSAAVLIAFVLGLRRLCGNSVQSTTLVVGVLALLAGSLTFARNQQYGDFAALIEQEAKSHPDHPRAQYNLAHMLNESGRPEAALRALAKVQKLDAEYGPAYSLEAAILLNAGRYQEAREILEALVAREPNNQLALGNLAICLSHLGFQAEAEDHIQRALACGANDHLTQFASAQILRRAKKHAEALEACERSLESRGDFAPALALKAALLARKGQLDDAVSVHQLALKMGADPRQEGYNLALVQFSLGAYAKAVAALDLAMESGRRDPGTRLFRVQLLQSARQFAAAIQEAKALRAHSNQQSLRANLEQLIRECEWMARFEKELNWELPPEILAADIPKAKGAAFAKLAFLKGKQELALKGWRRLFRQDPRIASDLSKAYRYTAVCHALALARNQESRGNRQAALDDAVVWLRADFLLRKRQAEFPSSKKQASAALEYWLEDLSLRLGESDLKTAAWKALVAEIRAFVAQI